MQRITQGLRVSPRARTPGSLPLRRLSLRAAIVLGSLAYAGTIPKLHGGIDVMQLDFPDAASILARLRREHPRLLLNRESLESLKTRIPRDDRLAAWHDALRARCEAVLAEPPSHYEIPDGLRLLMTSRNVLERVTTLALEHRILGDDRYVDRAWRELEAAAAFPDWNPRHFLDTAEMAHAFAIGYDWLHDEWSEDQRALLRAAIVGKALQPALSAYRGEAAWSWWPRADHNWNQVCNGGIVAAALAVAEEEPGLAGEILGHALDSIRRPMARYAPDGAWPEGPGYWHYGTGYNVLFLAVLESAFGTDFGLAEAEGFARTALFPVYATGPTGRTFNFADGSDRRIRAPELFWLSTRFDDPVAAWAQERAARPDPWDLLWYGGPGEGPRAAGLPLDRHFRGPEVVILRGAWEDGDATFLAFKAGDNRANHSHLDLGTFVLEALGTRWAIDLGADNYNLPGFFGQNRLSYYRLRTEGHNTLVLDPGPPAGQDPAASARIVAFSSAANRAFAVADLTPAYAPHAKRAARGVALLDRRSVLIQDEVATETPSTVWWFLHTRAEIELDPSRPAAAVLRDGDRSLWAFLLEPAGAAFQSMPARPFPSSPDPEGQSRNEGVRKLAIRLDDAADARIAVALIPADAGSPPPRPHDAVIPLDAWNDGSRRSSP